MSRKIDFAKRVISGTWAELWLDGELVGECYGCQAKVTADKEKIAMCGRMMSDSKVMGLSGTGSIRLHKVSSRMIELLGEAMKTGSDPRFTLISKLKDPDAYGAERVALYGVSFDDLTLIDWEAKTVGRTECPFTFSDFDPLDIIAA